MKEVEVRLEIPIDPNKEPERWEYLQQAELLLSKAGVSFDTGFGGGVRDWELDWSLHGASIVFIKFKEEDK